MLIRANFDFIGRESRSAQAYTLTWGGSNYEYLGGALSCSMVPFQFDQPMAPFASVLWRITWQPKGDTTCGARLIHADSGPANIVQLAEITGNSTPNGQSTNTGVDITTAMNTLRTAGAWKQIIMQVKGGAAAFGGMIIHSSALEVVYDITGA